MFGRRIGNLEYIIDRLENTNRIYECKIEEMRKDICYKAQRIESLNNRVEAIIKNNNIMCRDIDNLRNDFNKTIKNIVSELGYEMVLVPEQPARIKLEKIKKNKE